MPKANREAMLRARRAMKRACVSLILAGLACGMTACSSASTREEKAVAVIDGQADLLRKLVEERSDPKVADKVNADPDLKRAEEHLDLVIEMLEQSGQSVRGAL